MGCRARKKRAKIKRLWMYRRAKKKREAMDLMNLLERASTLSTLSTQRKQIWFHGREKWIVHLQIEMQATRSVVGSSFWAKNVIQYMKQEKIQLIHVVKDAMDRFILNVMQQDDEDVEDAVDAIIFDVLQRRGGKDFKKHHDDLYRALARVADTGTQKDAFNEFIDCLDSGKCYSSIEGTGRHEELRRALRALEQEITEIREQMHRFCANYISIRQIQEKDSSPMVRRGIGPIVKEPQMVGREDEMKRLLDYLVEGELQLTLIPIFGDSGKGKTTLAAEAYNSVYIKNYFECRAWVYVSSKYKQEAMLEAALKGIMPLSVSKKGMVADELKETLRKYLTNKRYIIVLDDVWHSDPWEHLSEILPDNNNGSRVMLTTRFKKMTPSTGVCVHPFELRNLKSDDSWELFCNKVFGDGICPPELVPDGKHMVSECRGWPLAIMLFGGLLSKTVKNDLAWQHVRSDLFPGSKGIMLALRDLISYSFTDLPLLKPCLLYFCVFPEGHEISTRHLFLLWIAEGFIPRNSEVIAEEYLEELIDRSLIQVVRRKSDGKVKTCRINDLPWEESLLLARESEMLCVPGTHLYWSRSPNFARRLAAHIDPSVISSKFYSPLLRSLLCITSDKSHLALDSYYSICEGFKLLRVLDLGAVVFDHLPDAIENLSLLRYLRLNVPSLDIIPSKLCNNLRNLYTLDMPHSRINHVSHDIWKMQRIRHIYCSFIRLPGPANSKTDCYSLRYLNFISTLCPSSCTQDVLGSLPNLRTLRICGDLSSLSNNLPILTCLQSLKLVGDANLSQLSSVVLSEFRFPPILTHLTLSNTGVSDDPMPTLEKLPNLQVLKLKSNSYRGRELVCSSQGFPRLQVLHLKSMQWLEEWTMEKDAMSHLVCLVINPCAYLRRLPEELWHVKSFRKLELWWPRPELKPRLQEIEDMDLYDVQIYPYGL